MRADVVGRVFVAGGDARALPRFGSVTLPGTLEVKAATPKAGEVVAEPGPVACASQGNDPGLAVRSLVRSVSPPAEVRTVSLVELGCWAISSRLWRS